MRILSVGNMYPPHHFGGAELIWRSAVQHQRSAGHAVRVLTTDFRLQEIDPDMPEDADVHRELRWYWRDHRFPRLSPWQRWRIERHNAQVIDRHLSELEPDVVVWWSMGGMSLSLLRRAHERGLPAVGVLLDDWLIYGPRVDAWQRMCGRIGALGPGLARVARAPLAGQLGQLADWVFMSETVRRRAAEAGVDVGGSRVAYRGIDPEGFAPGSPRQWGGDLLYVGRIDPRKGIETAIRSLASLPRARLDVVGDGDGAYLERLRRLAREEGLRERVSFRRVSRGEIPALMAAADALLFPVVWEEPWGLVPLEAMAAGTPVVATGRGGSGEYLRNRENCLLYEPADDPQALAAAVRELADDAALRGRLRGGGLRTTESLSVESFNDAVLEAISEAVS